MPPPPTPTPCHCESVTPWCLLSHLDLATAVSLWLLVATVDETHLPLLPPVARSAQPRFFASAFTVHRYLLLSFPSKPNKMFMTLWFKNLRFIESRNCACVVRTCGLVVFQFSCLSFLCLCCELWWIVLVCAAAACGFFFFFFVWLFGFVTLSLYVCD